MKTMHVPIFCQGRISNSNMTNLLSLLNILFVQSELQLLLSVSQRQMEKQRRLEKEQQLLKKARDHYEKVLLRKLGMVPWKKLREQAKENLVVSAEDEWTGAMGKGKRMDAAFNRNLTNLTRLLSQAEMGKAKILPSQLALYSFCTSAHLTVIMKGHQKTARMASSFIAD